MGQYYRGTILNKNYKKVKQPVAFSVDAWSFDNGAKLMEHSWVGNHYVEVFVNLLAGKFYDSRFVWAGDYAEEKFNGSTLYHLASDKDIIEESLKQIDNLVEVPQRWGNGTCYELKDVYIEGKPYKYIINFSKRQYVEIPEDTDSNNYEDWRVHPLPLLCCESNGLGSGDYFSPNNKDLVGKWAYDRIGIGNEIPEGFKPLKFDQVDEKCEKIIFKE